MPEYIARISYGKDSLKMLEVIKSRSLPLDRITTTDVWATDTISANLPPMDAFKAKMDQWIWDKYRIEVEHLCSLNSDGTKRTYEQMFYHVPVRRSKSVQVERESRHPRVNQRIPAPWRSVVSVCTQTRYQSTDFPQVQSRDSHYNREHGANSSNSIGWGRPQGFPAQISPWCRKLKNLRILNPLF